MSTTLVALVAMFVQQTFASVGKVLPAVIAPLVLAELHADPVWVGVYFGIAAAAAMFAQMGCGSFIIRYGATAHESNLAGAFGRRHGGSS